VVAAPRSVPRNCSHAPFSVVSFDSSRTATPQLLAKAVAACVVGGVQLMGGRGTLVGAVAGALTLFALFTLLTLLGLPQPLKDTAQGLILIAAVAIGAWRRRRAA